MSEQRRPVRILSEETRRGPVPDAPTDETPNPYWEEPPPHPDPSRGCIRRGLCCQSSPGFFAPGEVEAAAALLELSPDTFARLYLVIDRHVCTDGVAVEVFAPLKLDRHGAPALPPLSRVDELYRLLRGPCVFYAAGGCRIYAARPAECRAYVCTNDPAENLSHEQIAHMWRSQS